VSGQRGPRSHGGHATGREAGAARTMPTHTRALAALTLPAIALVAACGGGGGSTGSPTSNLPTVAIGIIVPTSADPYVAQFIKRGAQQGVNEANQKGGVTVGGKTYQLALKLY